MPTAANRSSANRSHGDHLNPNLPGLLPSVTVPVRLDDLPGLLGPYAKTAPIYVYLMSCGNIKATRLRLKDEGDLILVLSPHGQISGLQN